MKTITLNIPDNARAVIVKIEFDEEEQQLPLYVMNARPDEWRAHPEWASVGVVGVHLRIPQHIATPEYIREQLDLAEYVGTKVGLVIAVHNSRDWGMGTVFTRYQLQLRDGEIIPDYWSNAFFDEWINVRSQIANVVNGHPALAWVGHDFGLDDESWPTKPWSRVRTLGLDIWDYMMRYVVSIPRR